MSRSLSRQNQEATAGMRSIRNPGLPSFRGSPAAAGSSLLRCCASRCPTQRPRKVKCGAPSPPFRIEPMTQNQRLAASDAAPDSQNSARGNRNVTPSQGDHFAHQNHHLNVVSTSQKLDKSHSHGLLNDLIDFLPGFPETLCQSHVSPQPWRPARFATRNSMSKHLFPSSGRTKSTRPSMNLSRQRPKSRPVSSRPRKM